MSTFWIFLFGTLILSTLTAPTMFDYLLEYNLLYLAVLSFSIIELFVLLHPEFRKYSKIIRNDKRRSAMPKLWKKGEDMYRILQAY